jgi:hypothetical protein
MSDTDTKSLRRLLIEGAAIVISILLAFALDAMWEERQLRQWETSQLAALSVDMAENLASLDAIVKAHGNSARNSESMLSLLGGVAVGDSVIIPNAFLVSLISWRTADISTGSLDALLASGKLGDIENAEIRKALASWPSRVLDAQEDENLARDFVEYVLTEKLAGQGVIAAAYSSRSTPADLDDTSRSRGETVVTVTPELIDFVTVRRVHSTMARESMIGLQEDIRKILGLLDSELD